MLYRAFVATDYPTVLSEATVFFETQRAGRHPGDHLKELLALAWGRDAASQAAFYNLESELELRERADPVTLRGPDRDVCLLVIGSGPQGATYAAPERTMLLVGPMWHARLTAAQRLTMAEIAARDARRRALLAAADARMRGVSTATATAGVAA